MSAFDANNIVDMVFFSPFSFSVVRPPPLFIPTFSPPGSLAAGALSAPLAAAAATSGAEAVDAVTEDVALAATGDSGGVMVEATDLLAAFTAELSDANAAASGGGCRSGLLESSDIAEETEKQSRSGKRESKPNPVLLFFFLLRPCLFFPFFQKK